MRSGRLGQLKITLPCHLGQLMIKPCGAPRNSVGIPRFPTSPGGNVFGNLLCPNLFKDYPLTLCRFPVQKRFPNCPGRNRPYSAYTRSTGSMDRSLRNSYTVESFLQAFQKIFFERSYFIYYITTSTPSQTTSTPSQTTS